MAKASITEQLKKGDIDAETRRQLFALIYSDLRSRASRVLGGHDNPSLSTTALVHETYLKLIDAPLSLQSKSHFFHAAAQAMRQIMVDHARSRLTQKRDRKAQVTLEDALAPVDGQKLSELIALHQALERLHAEDEGLAQIVELHFFGGLKFDEIAELSNRSLSTIEREWRIARAMLHRYMK